MQQQPGRPRRCNPDEAPKKNPARGSVGCPGGIERGHTTTRSAQAAATARPPRRKICTAETRPESRKTWNEGSNRDLRESYGAHDVDSFCKARGLIMSLAKPHRSTFRA